MIDNEYARTPTTCSKMLRVDLTHDPPAEQ